MYIQKAKVVYATANIQHNNIYLSRFSVQNNQGIIFEYLEKF